MVPFQQLRILNTPEKYVQIKFVCEYTLVCTNFNNEMQCECIMQMWMHMYALS